MTTHIYQAINAVQAELSRDGISKDRSNQQQGYKFRGIDDVYNALAPLLAKHGLCILPRCTERDVVERVNAKGTALFYVTVRAEFDFVAAEDGSKHTVVTYGEAMDSGDKATNKAMSAAYKYACMQAFSIPTEGDNDADATTHEVKPRSANEDRRITTGMSPEQIADWLAKITEAATEDKVRAAMTAGLDAARAAKDKAAFDAIQAAGKKRWAALTKREEETA